MRATLWFLGLLWASPISLFGGLLAVLGGARLLGWREGALDFLAPPAGAWALFFGARFGAINFGDVIVYRDAIHAASKATRAHEREHQKQARRLGLLHPILYLVIVPLVCWAYRVDAYRDQPAELAARRAAGQETGP